MNLNFEDIKQGYDSGRLDPADATALTLIRRLQYLYPKTFLQGARKPPLALSAIQDHPINHWLMASDGLPVQDLWKLISQYKFKGLQERISLILVAWKEKKCSLILTEEIPTPEQILRYQARGQRVVTVFWQKSFLGKMITDTKDDFHFTLHDLEHAERFLTQDYQGQIAFYQKLLAWQQRDFSQTLLSDSQFLKDYHYLISDMNTHPAHQFSYLEAAIINWQKRQWQQSPLPTQADQERAYWLAPMAFNH